MQNNCTGSPLEDSFEDALAGGLGAGFGLRQLQVLGNEIALPCSHVFSCKVQLPIKDMGRGPFITKPMPYVAALHLVRN